jgi:glycosyltransferase involved in cell wall biosynthesis
MRGGVERYYFALTKLLEDNHHDVVHFAMKDDRNLPCKYEDFFVDNIEVGKPGLNLLNKIMRPIWYKDAQKKISQLVDETQPDIAHFHLLYHHLSPSILPVLKKKGIPIVMTVHDYKLMCPNYLMYTENDTCKRCKGHKYYNAIIHKCLKDSYAVSAYAAFEMSVHKLMQVYEKHVDTFIVPSVFMRDLMVEFGHNPTKIVVIPHFVDPQFLETAKQVESIKAEKPYLLYFGRLSEEKGVDKILETMYIYKPGIALKIAGSGPKHEELLDFVQTHDLPDIEFLGHLDVKDLISYIKGAEAVLVPSQSFESFGFSALEAMALGTPVVSTEQGALKEIVDPSLGVTFPYKDKKAFARAIHQAIKMDKAIVQQKAKEIISKKYLPERHFESLMNVYEHLLTTKKETDKKV